MLSFIESKIPKAHSCIVPDISTNAVFKYLRNINCKKATGLDNIPGHVIRSLGAELERPITEIVSFLIHGKSLMSYPYIKGIKKQYRKLSPVSVLCIISKILEQHIFNTLYTFLRSMMYLQKINLDSAQNIHVKPA